MCYHASTPKKTDLKKQFPKKQVFYESDKIYHVSGFTRPFLPVTLNSNQESIITARWKLIPFWVKNEADAAKYANTLNAEGESIFTKASYRPYIGKQRGLLYVDGFFEPHQVKGVKESQNYYIYKPNHKIFTLGMVYSIFADQDTGETYPTFSIITTKANSLLEEIHNVKKRMPLIIPENKREDWLSANTESQIKELINPYQGTLDAHQVYRVTGARSENTNRPDIIKPI
ncbi:MAG TPA: SOS response-associated peptidase [Candidatus Sphingobacterium stercoripullorum]|uniref:Abasic site processing protein n=1 Tax=Candidatus Sphingobacterium stercoripullorum TaxID=2838759 RepID=A0A9D2AZ12_9SPHI|nr:SOS response-associated peptidase [Candidatus Sphingobacterium stercoripullorum]